MNGRDGNVVRGIAIGLLIEVLVIAAIVAAWLVAPYLVVTW